MERLNQRAFDLLKAEIERLAGQDPVGKVQQEIALKRLQRLRTQQGEPPTVEELRDLVDDLFPAFSEKVLKAAVRANHSGRSIAQGWSGIKLGAAVVVSIVGGVWFLNLPYPPIRWTVARIAPMVLLPSFIQMDHNYRQAIAHTEQADQLVNQATSTADLELGKTKMQAAQKNLDALPVWFLGFYPQQYCTLFTCGWRFTFDEFQEARKDVARMEAKLFQETNAQTQLEQADQMVSEAKQKYQEAPDESERKTAITQWQQGIDQLQQIPSETLAGKQAQTKLQAYERDFEQVVGYAAGNARSGNLIEAARAFDAAAMGFGPDKPQSVATWEQIIGLWEKAIAELSQIPVDEASYVEAKKMIAHYETKRRQAEIRLVEEQAAIAAYAQAETLTARLLENATNLNNSQIAGQLRQIEQELGKVKAGTTVFEQASQLRQQAAAKRREASR